MACAIVVGGTAASSTSNVTSYAMGAFTPNANSLLIGWALASGTVAVATASGGSLTWTLLTSVAFNAGVDTFYLFYATTPASPASLTWTFDCTGDAATGCCQGIFQVTGCESIFYPYYRQKKSATSTGSANPSLTLDKALSTNNGAIYVAGNGTNSAVQWTAPTGFTELNEVAYNTPANSGTSGFVNSGRTDSTLTWTNANTTEWIVFAMELYALGQFPEPIITPLQSQLTNHYRPSVVVV